MFYIVLVGPLRHIFKHQNQFPMSIFDKVMAKKRSFPLAAILNFAHNKKCSRVTKWHQAVLGSVGSVLPESPKKRCMYSETHLGHKFVFCHQTKVSSAYHMKNPGAQLIGLLNPARSSIIKLGVRGGGGCKPPKFFRYGGFWKHLTWILHKCMSFKCLTFLFILQEFFNENLQATTIIFSLNLHD